LPVSNQKGINVAAIPCGLLRLQYGADGCAIGIVHVGRLGKQGPLHEQTANRQQSYSSGSKDRPANPSHGHPPGNVLVYLNSYNSVSR
jgi:hypothetical protein